MPAHNPVSRDRAHLKAVQPRPEILIINDTLFRRRAPILIRAFELVLVVQSFARIKLQTYEINAYLVLSGGELDRSNCRFAAFGKRKGYTSNLKSIYQNRRLGFRSIRLRKQP